MAAKSFKIGAAIKKSSKSPVVRYAKIVFGVLFTVAGIVGLILPIIPGWLFLLPGVALLSSGSPWFAKNVMPFLQKYMQKIKSVKGRIFPKRGKKRS